MSHVTGRKSPVNHRYDFIFASRDLKTESCRSIRLIEMAIPDFKTLMRPVLVTLADGQERPVAAIRDTVLGSSG